MPATKVFSFEPMLCESAERPPESHHWQYELKLDGFRAIGRKSGRTTQLWSRNHKDFVRRFPGVASALFELPSDTVISIGSPTAWERELIDMSNRDRASRITE